MMKSTQSIDFLAYQMAILVTKRNIELLRIALIASSRCDHWRLNTEGEDCIPFVCADAKADSMSTLIIQKRDV